MFSECLEKFVICMKYVKILLVLRIIIDYRSIFFVVVKVILLDIKK